MEANTFQPAALVTGGRGFLGVHVVKALRQAGYIAVTIGTGKARGTEPHFQLNRLNDKSAIIAILKSLKPVLVVHLAAAPPPAGLDVHHDVTVAGTQALIATLEDFPAVQLLAVGSAAEFGTDLPAFGRLADNYPCKPVSIYGRAKYAATQEVLNYRARGGPASVLRLFTACGPNPPPHSLLGGIVSQLRANDGVLRINGFERVRDYLPVEAAATMIVKLVLQGSALPPVMNLCSGHETTVGQWVAALVAAYGLPMRLTPLPGSLHENVPRRVVGDPATLISFGITPPSIILPAMAAKILAR